MGEESGGLGEESGGVEERRRFFREGDRKEIVICTVSRNKPKLLPTPSRCSLVGLRGVCGVEGCLWG